MWNHKVISRLNPYLLPVNATWILQPKRRQNNSSLRTLANKLALEGIINQARSCTTPVSCVRVNERPSLKYCLLPHKTVICAQVRESSAQEEAIACLTTTTNIRDGFLINSESRIKLYKNTANSCYYVQLNKCTFIKF